VINSVPFVAARWGEEGGHHSIGSRGFFAGLSGMQIPDAFSQLVAE